MRTEDVLFPLFQIISEPALTETARSSGEDGFTRLLLALAEMRPPSVDPSPSPAPPAAPQPDIVPEVVDLVLPGLPGPEPAPLPELLQPAPPTRSAPPPAAGPSHAVPDLPPRAADLPQPLPAMPSPPANIVVVPTEPLRPQLPPLPPELLVAQRWDAEAGRLVWLRDGLTIGTVRGTEPPALAELPTSQPDILPPPPDLVLIA